MAKKAWEMGIGEVTTPPVGGDELLQSKMSERKRKEIARQEEEDEATHEARMAEMKKKARSADAATEKVGEKAEAPGGFKTTGEIKMGVIDLQAERTQAVQELKELKKEQEEITKALGVENQQLRDRIHEQEMKVISTTFQAALDRVEGKGSLADQLAGVRVMAKELGMAQPDIGAGDPALQVQMLQLQHAEAQREREFQWQMQKDREAREDRKEERIDERSYRTAELAIQREKTEMFAKAPEVLGRAIASGMMSSPESGGRGIASKNKSGYHIEAGEGQGGEIECPNPGCKEPIGVGPTARAAVCATCGTRVSIKRVKSETPAPPLGEEDEEEE